MLRLGFSLVRLGLIWIGCFPCLKKSGENTGGENQYGEIPSGEKTERGKDLAGKRPSEEKTGGENT